MINLLNCFANFQAFAKSYKATTILLDIMSR